MLPDLAGMEVRIVLHKKYIAKDLLWDNAIDLVHQQNIYFWRKVYLLSAECFSAAKQKWNRQISWCSFL